MTLVRVPDAQPVRFQFSYGPSTWLKRIYLSDAFVPLKEWPSEVKEAL